MNTIIVLHYYDIIIRIISISLTDYCYYYSSYKLLLLYSYITVIIINIFIINLTNDCYYMLTLLPLSLLTLTLLICL